MKSNSIFDVPDGRQRALALLNERTDRTETCWLWTRGRTADGYGKFKLSGSYLYAHRVSYEVHVGPIPESLFILHSCDTPACVNPAHLRPGTQKENMHDRDSRGRGPGGRTHCPKGHQYDEVNTYRPSNRNARVCRACRREFTRRWREKQLPRPSTVSAVLLAAARILQANGLWQGDHVVDPCDREISPVEVPHTMRPMSIVAALKCASTGDPHASSQLGDTAVGFVALSIDGGPYWEDGFSLEAHVDEWNDAPARTTDDAVALLEMLATAPERAA